MYKIIKKIFTCILLLTLIIILLGYTYTLFKEGFQKLVTPEEVKKLTISEGDISFVTYGVNSNQPIILLHGTGANGFIWEKTSRFLAENGYYVIAPDLPPFGWSFIPITQDYRKEKQAARIVELTERLSLTNPIIVGHSFNSKVALQIADQTESRQLVLVAPVLDYDMASSTPLVVNSLVSLSLLRDPLLSLFVNNTLLAEKILLSFMYKKDADFELVLEKTVMPFNKKGVNHAYGEWFQEFFKKTSLLEDAAALRNQGVPITVLWGDKDAIAPIDNFEKLLSINKTAILITLPEVGHMPHLENTSLFNEKLLGNLKK